MIAERDAKPADDQRREHDNHAGPAEQPGDKGRQCQYVDRGYRQGIMPDNLVGRHRVGQREPTSRIFSLRHQQILLQILCERHHPDWRGRSSRERDLPSTT